MLDDKWFCHFLHPNCTRTKDDNSSQTYVVCGIQNSSTTPYHPQRDRLVEHSLLDMLATTTKDHPFNLGRSTGRSAWYTTPLCSRQLGTPLFPGVWMPGLNNSGHHRQIRPLERLPPPSKATLENAYNVVRHKTDKKQERQKHFYHRRLHGKPFSVGDQVWFHSPEVPCGKSRKLHHPSTGNEVYCL